VDVGGVLGLMGGGAQGSRDRVDRGAHREEGRKSIWEHSLLRLIAVVSPDLTFPFLPHTDLLSLCPRTCVMGEVTCKVAS
jgi:hypothetical protein